MRHIRVGSFSPVAFWSNNIISPFNFFLQAVLTWRLLVPVSAPFEISGLALWGRWYTPNAFMLKVSLAGSRVLLTSMGKEILGRWEWGWWCPKSHRHFGSECLSAASSGCQGMLPTMPRWERSTFLLSADVFITIYITKCFVWLCHPGSVCPHLIHPPFSPLKPFLNGSLFITFHQFHVLEKLLI